MKYIFLIALREFAENAKTKGFWIGIFTLPVIMAISIAVASIAFVPVKDPPQGPLSVAGTVGLARTR